MELIIFPFAFAVISALAASSRGRSGVGWFFLGLVFGPFALLAVLVMARIEPAAAPRPASRAGTGDRTGPYRDLTPLPPGPARQHPQKSQFARDLDTRPADGSPDSIVNGHPIWRTKDGFTVDGWSFATRREAMDHADSKARGPR